MSDSADSHREITEPASVDLDATVAMPGRTGRLPGIECPGDMIGRYRLIEPLGEGGFGTVWRAEQKEPIHREVALKVIKLGMDSVEIIARFEAERQALALMDHPNIASILDAGTTENGRPYFVMDLVRGVPITDYCDIHRLTIRQRLELFIPVCQAVQHAHQKAILHRDLKPSNILVAEVDEQPVPKVIDFGIAKALGGTEDQANLGLTHEGAIIGTPQYMSPEQAGASTDLDTRSDIYTLGVILYELLTGGTPLPREALRQAAFDEVLRLIREADPVRPSSRVVPVTEALRQTSTARGTDPAKLPRTLRGDLDWITLKALEKERNRRYESAAAFAQDLQRHLAEEPVEASPPSGLYRLRKLVRRNRIAVGASLAIVLLLIAGIGVSTWQAVRAKRAEALSQVERQRFESLLTKTQLQRAEELFDDGEASGGIAYLAHVLRRHPDDRVTASRLLSSLRDRSHARRIGSPWKEAGARIIGWAQDGESLLIATNREIVSWRDGESTPEGTPFLEDLWFGNANHWPSLSPDRRMLIAFHDWGACRLYDSRDGKAITPELQHDRSFSGGVEGLNVAFSSDGRLIATVLSSYDLCIWDTASGAQVAKFVGIRPSAAAFHPDGKMLAVGSRMGLVQLFDTDGKSWKLRQKWQLHEHAIRSVTFTQDHLFARCGCGELLGYKLGEAELDAEPLQLGRVASLDFSRAGDVVLVARDGHWVELLSTTTGQLVIDAVDAGKQVREVSLSADGSQFLAATETGVQVWSRSSFGRLMATREFPTSLALDAYRRHKSVQFSPDGRRLAVAQIDGTISIWDVALTRSLPVVFPMSGTYSEVDLHPRGELLATSNYAERQFAVWNLSTGSMESSPVTAVPENRSIKALAFEPGSERIWTGTDGPSNPDNLKLQSWHWPSGTRVGKGMATDGWVYRLAFDLSGRRLCLEDFSSHILQTPGLNELEGPWTRSRGALSSDGHTFLETTSDRLQRWNVDTGQPESPPIETEQPIKLTFSKGNREICITTHDDGSVRGWDTISGESLGPAVRHNAAVHSATTHAPSDVLVTGSADHTARLWRISTGEPLGDIMTHQEEVSRAELSPDGRRVATTCGDGTVRLWDVPSGRPLTEPLLVVAGEAERCLWHPDGVRLITSGNSPAQCWDMPVLSEVPPAWLADWAEAVGGFRLDPKGDLVALPLEADRPFREEAASTKAADIYSSTLRWFYEPVGTRKISPNAKVTRRDLVASLCSVDDSAKPQMARDLAPEEPMPWVSLLWSQAEKGTGIEAALQRTLEPVAERGVATGEAGAFLLDAILRANSEPQRAVASCRKALTLGLNPFWTEQVKLRLLRSPPNTVAVAEKLTLLNELIGPEKLADSLDPARRTLVAERRGLLVQENRIAEAAAANVALLSIPPRAADTPESLFDLTAFYNARLDEKFTTSTVAFGEVPPGVRDFKGIPFDVRGVIFLRARMKDSDTALTHQADFDHPLTVPGIRVRVPCRKLHFLHCAVAQFAPPDKEMGAYVIHYEDGQEARLSLFKDRQIHDCYRLDQVMAKDVPTFPGVGLTLRTVWSGHTDWTRKQPSARLYLYALSWENPRPEVPVKSVELVSNAENAGLCVLAITRE